MAAKKRNAASTASPKSKEPKGKTKYSYGIHLTKDLPPPGTPKYKMMVLSGEIKE